MTTTPVSLRAAPRLRRACAVAACALGCLAPWRAAAQSPDQPAIVKAEFIYDRAPYPQCHASTIVEAAPGRLVAAWFGGTEERAADVGIWVARHEDGRWTEAVEVANGAQPDGMRHPTWNPVLFKAPDGLLWLFYKVGPSPSTWWGMVRTSSDGGRTWGQAHRLPSPLLGPIKNKPVVLPDGAWLSASSTEGTPTGWRAHFELSADQGRTWRFIGPIDKGDAGLEAIQGSVIVHRNGRLQALLRTRNGVVATTWSSDLGRTWTALTPTSVLNPNSGTDALTLRDGRHLLVFNPTAVPAGAWGGPRYPLVVAVSEDGLAWRDVATLDYEPAPAGYSYPAVVQTEDGLVHITYTWKRERIRHVVVDPARIK